ncbi:DUF1624 domain-containing protein [Caulobacter sp. UNC358MFTsu5.1]|uniref:DUF1624 domain-containing protein n=1 Tax=Caulobacter sp. UNC358MFTsu5.1 TaxID=1449049 RepID=UPI000A44D9F7|nr:heparan-alpha-glucosaminide N-acetyltransferase domain-containing protein [Caulobacter sp. UNC358MFTsu5.1]
MDTIASSLAGLRPQALSRPGLKPLVGDRLGWVDQLRGLAMIVMALDHVRDFVHRGAMSAAPTDLATTTPLLFATRWITHLCAPTFALTAGLGAFLWWRKGRGRGQLSWFLASRGVWLMVLELLVMRLAYYFSWSPQSPVLLLVLWSLGLSMLGLAALVWLPRRWLAPLALAIILLNPLLDAIPAARLGPAAGLWNLIHEVGAFKLLGATVVTPYPLLPWIGIMLLGFSLGPLCETATRTQRRWLVLLGLAALVGFLVLRVINLYGDPAPWRAQGSAIYTAMSFLNVTKYPASPDFVLMTLGAAFLLAALLTGASSGPGWAGAALRSLGRAPLFYYVLHFFLAHLIATALALAAYGWRARFFVFSPYPSMGGAPGQFPADFGHELAIVYAVWLALVAICYPLCVWYAGLKARRGDWWLSYL